MPTLPATLPFTFNDGSAAVSSDVPGLFPAALNGRPLMISDVETAGWAHQGIQLLRTQADGSVHPSERSLNPAGLWRAAQESWHRGAGQDFLDRDGSDEFRFSTSQGVDVWTPYQLSLLPDTDQKKSGSSTNYKLCPAGSRLYLIDGSTIVYTTDVTVDSPTWSSTTYAGGALLDICSDGYNVYVTDGSNIYVSNTGSTTFTSTNTLDAGLLGFVKGRLMAAGTSGTKHILYNVSVIGTPPSALFTPFNTDFTWVGFAEGDAQIYAAGYSGDKSVIYRIAVKTDGTALDAPIVAGKLPDGEIVRGIGGYLGFILLGTDKGVRFCEVSTSGDLNIGPRIDTDNAVRCFEGQERFVWYGLTNYTASSTGLGRMDLTQFTTSSLTEARAPAYATDLMATSQGAVLSVCTFQNLRVFTVSAVGVFAETSTKVTTSTIASGKIGFGLPDDKIAVSVDIRSTPLTSGASYSASFSVDTVSTAIGTEDGADTTSSVFPIEDGTGGLYELTLTLAGSGSVSPTIIRWTLKATPGPNDGPTEYLMVPFLLHRVLRPAGGGEIAQDPKEERDAIKALRESRQIVTYQEDSSSYQVQVENFEWHPDGLLTDDRSGEYTCPDGTMLTQLKRIV